MEPAQDEFLHVVRQVRGHWLTRAPDVRSFFVSMGLVFALAIASLLYWGDVFHAGNWMTAIPQNVFQGHEYWRLWTALFAHEDQAHLLSNSFLFFVFAYFLYGHFGKWVFPAAAFFFGGIINAIVLTTMPFQAELLGVSGVVYWMGAVWLTLYLLLETRERIFRRAIKSIGIAIVLFIPETIQPHISYLSHFIGFVLGVAWAIGYYLYHRRRFKEAEIIELLVE